MGTTSFLPLPRARTASVKGRVISIIAQTRSRPHLQVRFWGRDSTGEVFVLEETREGLVDVTKNEIGLPQYVGIVPMVRQLSCRPCLQSTRPLGRNGG
jgi:hypothetical protein